MKLSDRILSVLRTAKDFTVEQLEQMSARHEQQQAAIRQQQFFAFNNQLAVQMQGELFEVFQNTPYRFLKSVTLPSDIMFVRWRVQQGQTIFTFQVNVDPMPTGVVLKQCMSDIKNVIYQHQQNLIMALGFEEAQLLYPCIVNGLYIANIRQIGCMVQFDVITNVRF